MAEGKRYFWLKLYDDFFDSKRIKKLRRLAGGDTYTIIYLKIQLLAMKKDGVLEWTGLEDSFAEELALDLDESTENVEMTLRYLLSTGLAEMDEDSTHYFFPYAVINTGSETASTRRSRECRQRKNQAKLLQCNTDATQVQQMCNTDATQVQQMCNGEIEIEKEKESYLEIDIESEEEVAGETPDVSTPNKTEGASGDLSDTTIKYFTQGERYFGLAFAIGENEPRVDVADCITTALAKLHKQGNNADCKKLHDFALSKGIGISREAVVERGKRL